MEDIVIIEPQDYSQVSFENIQETYPGGMDLQCFFKVNELMKIEDSDIIGLYKVGFKNSNEHVTSVAVNTKEINENGMYKVVMNGDKIPNDYGQFYQLVYVSQGKFRGVSAPFQFMLNESNDSTIESVELVELTTDRSSSSLIIEEIAKKLLNLDVINSEQEEIGNECIKMISDMMEIKFCCEDEISSPLERSETEDSEVYYQSDSDVEIDTIVDRDELNERTNFPKTYGVFEKKISELRTQFELIKRKKEDLCVESSCKMNKFYSIKQNLESKPDCDFKKEIEELDNEVNALQSLFIENLREFENLKSDIIVQFTWLTKKMDEYNMAKDMMTTKNVFRVIKAKEKLERDYADLLRENSNNLNKLKLSEDCNEALKKGIKALSFELELAKQTAVSAEKKSTEYGQQLLEDNQRLLLEIEQLKKDHATKIDEMNGAYYGLHVANMHLENRIKHLQEKIKTENEVQNENIKFLEENNRLKKYIDEHKLDYEILYNKYSKLKKIVEKCNKMARKINETVDNDYVVLSDSEDETPEPLIKTKDEGVDEYIQSVINSNLYKPSISKLNISKPNFEAFYPTLPKSNNLNDSVSDVSSDCADIDVKQEPIVSYESPCDCMKYNNTQCQCGSTCQICLTKFPKYFSRSEFESHVNSHFAQYY